jgi:hypothetical protein
VAEPAAAAMLVVLLCGLALAVWARTAGGAAPAVADAAAVTAAATPGGAAAGARSAAALVQAAPRRAPAAQASLGCERCHGELELLRQQVPTLARAQQVLVPEHVVAGSAHGGMSCAECHSGYTRYPHEELGTRTESCASCHAAADTLWQLSTHAGADDQVTCAQCHGTHDVRTAETLRSDAGTAHANAPCLGCHQTEALPAHEPHADERVLCAAATRRTTRGPWTTRNRGWRRRGRPQTCAACHEEHRPRNGAPTSTATPRCGWRTSAGARPRPRWWCARPATPATRWCSSMMPLPRRLGGALLGVPRARRTHLLQLVPRTGHGARLARLGVLRRLPRRPRHPARHVPGIARGRGKPRRDVRRLPRERQRPHSSNTTRTRTRSTARGTRGSSTRSSS